eukprot:CAMPEP_0185901106 /NCGR_PEP_ID=MMETSP0196C-20130402/504_1 /TAXON_ID=2932 /ORGANISM="Alexandrium fundyense, Strain CCMP1719" /LENGTH=100 /DNA_ID=CAMNT_0028619705 /DNA_START=24 /DNA_END=326 /DNA_ORIENTATION=-
MDVMVPNSPNSELILASSHSSGKFLTYKLVKFIMSGFKKIPDKLTDAEKKKKKEKRANKKRKQREDKKNKKGKKDKKAKKAKKEKGKKVKKDSKKKHKKA